MAGSRTSNDLTVIRQLARQFNYKQGKASETDFAPSEYVPLLNAVRDGRVDEAKKLTEALVAEKGEKVVEQYFKDLPNKRFTGNKEREEEFVKSLTPHQQDVYAKAKAQNEATAKAFFEQILGKPVPTKGPKNSFGRLGLGHF
jgi:Asp-tRNA(Asn)/Glu-tRNA(Gln) amidotransferase B subunit